MYRERCTKKVPRIEDEVQKNQYVSISIHGLDVQYLSIIFDNDKINVIQNLEKTTNEAPNTERLLLSLFGKKSGVYSVLLLQHQGTSPTHPT